MMTTRTLLLNRKKKLMMMMAVISCWSFPVFIAFAMLGPIVPPAMVPYRTELFMTKLPPVPAGDTSNGRAAMRRMEKDMKMSTAVATVVVVK